MRIQCIKIRTYLSNFVISFVAMPCLLYDGATATFEMYGRRAALVGKGGGSAASGRASVRVAQPASVQATEGTVVNTSCLFSWMVHEPEEMLVVLLSTSCCEER